LVLLIYFNGTMKTMKITSNTSVVAVIVGLIEHENIMFNCIH